MSKIPTQEKNPHGLHQRYYIQKIVPNPHYIKGGDLLPEITGDPCMLTSVDENAEYFVLRLDSFGKDPVHIAACRKAVLCYAEEIKNHIPELYTDLIQRYSNH